LHVTGYRALVDGEQRETKEERQHAGKQQDCGY
jgi:hypothetical protein